MMYPLKHFVSAADGTNDAFILEDIEDQIGSNAEKLTLKDRLAFLTVLSRYVYVQQWINSDYSIKQAIALAQLAADTAPDLEEVTNATLDPEEIWDILLTLEGISTQSAFGLLQFITAQLSDKADKATALLMPKSWSDLVEEAMEEFEQILYLQELLQISSEQLGLKLLSPQTAQQRVGLLLNCYMEQVQIFMHSLKLTLKQMQQSVASS